jgi:hypothetical protein
LRIILTLHSGEAPIINSSLIHTSKEEIFHEKNR